MSGELVIEKVRPIKDRFDTAVAFIKTLPKDGPLQPSNTVKLRFYALFKQSTQGPCTGAKPSFWDAVGRAKWEAWSVCGKMSADLAMQMYIEELQQFVGTIPQTPEIEEFLRSIGPHPEGEEPELQSHSHSVGGAVDTERGLNVEVGEENGASEDVDTDGPLRNSNSEIKEPSRGHSEGVRSGNHSDSEGSEDFQESFMYLSRTPGVPSDDLTVDQYPREASVEQGASPSQPRRLLSGEITRTQTRALNDEVKVQINRWRSRVHYRFIPFLLSWPFALQFIIRFLIKRFGSPSSSSGFPWWVWSLVTFLHTACAMSLLTIFTRPPSR